ncbi:MAG: hypothetical protein SFW67_02095 [Myxococcaceae bacterium]|nr:hypothetical protein [Myxococcaceae bacterium]
MQRFALELVSAPPGVQVTFRGGASRLEGLPGGRYVIGRVLDADVVVSVEAEAWDELVKGGWGGRKHAFISVAEDGRWELEHSGHGALGPFVNGEPLRGRRALTVGDEVAPSRALVFRLVEVDVVEEPAALLDAIAEDPDDLGRWHVLADWLIERGAPHALMAAYELKLEQGTNDPDLLGDYVTVRRARQHLPTDVFFHPLAWRCGYVISGNLSLGPRYPHELDRLSRALALPQLAALSKLTLLAQGTESATRLEGVLAAIPKTVRTVGFHFGGAVPTAVLSALHRRPEKAHTLRLQLADPLGPLRAVVEVVAAAGWKVLDLEGTRLTDRVTELAMLVQRHPGLTFVLGGTSIGADDVTTLEAPNVRWAPPDADALAIDEVTGAVLPLCRGRSGFVWGLPLEPLGDAWLNQSTGAVMASGDRFLGAGRRYVYLQGRPLDEVYRAFVARRVAGTPTGT